MKKIKRGLLPPIPLSRIKTGDIIEGLTQENDEAKKKRMTDTDRLARKRRVKDNLDKANMSAISAFTSKKTADIAEMMESHPDIELASMILTSSILSPNDMIKTSLFYNAKPSILPLSTIYAINEFVEREMTVKYNIESELYDIVTESYVTIGSYSRIFIPFTKIKHLNTLFQSSTEAFKPESAVESLSSIVPNTKQLVRYTRDTSTLKVNSEIMEIVATTDDVSTEAIGDTISRKAKNATIASIFNNDLNNTDIINMTSGNDDDNRCITMKLPAESVIPLHFSNDPSKHYGYFVLLDKKGSPIVDHTRDASENEDSKHIAPSLVNKANNNIKNDTTIAPVLTNGDDILTEEVSASISKAISDNAGGAFISDHDKDTMLQMVLRRTLVGLKTTILYVPATQISYYAFKYRENGTGKPVLDNLNTISSLRSMLQFSKIAALIRNSIPNTDIKVQLDDNDPDAPKTIESIKAFIMNTRSLSLPFGLTKTSDIVNWLHRYGFSFSFKHADLPDMEIESTEVSKSYVIPDSDVENDLKKSIFMKMGLSPETVENSFSADFAATVVSQNALQAKRIMKIQEKLNKMITMDVSKFIRNDGYMNNKVKHIIKTSMKDIKKAMSSNYKEALALKGITDDDMVEFLFESYLESLEISLPEVVMEENGTKEAFDNYADSLDDYVEKFFSEDAIPEKFAKELSGNIELIQQSVKSTLLRRWMRKNGFMEELADVFEPNETGEIDSSVLKEYNEYIDNASTAVEAFMKDNAKLQKKHEHEEDDEEDTPMESESPDDN